MVKLELQPIIHRAISCLIPTFARMGRYLTVSGNPEINTNPKSQSVVSSNEHRYYTTGIGKATYHKRLSLRLYITFKPRKGELSPNEEQNRGEQSRLTILNMQGGGDTKN